MYACRNSHEIQLAKAIKCRQSILASRYPYLRSITEKRRILVVLFYALRIALDRLGPVMLLERLVPFLLQGRSGLRFWRAHLVELYLTDLFGGRGGRREAQWWGKDRE